MSFMSIARPYNAQVKNYSRGTHAVRIAVIVTLE